MVKFRSITLAFLLLSIPDRGFEQENTGSVAQKENDANSLTNVETVTYCDLTRDPELYNDKIVRVRAIYLSGFERSYLQDINCIKDEPPKLKRGSLFDETWVEFDPSYKTNTKSEIVKEFDVLRRLYRQVDLTAVGRFHGSREHGGYGHMAYARFKFVVLRLDQASLVEKEKN